MRYSMVLIFSCVLLIACKEQAASPATDTASVKTEQHRTGKPGAAVQLQHRIMAPVVLTQPVTVELELSSDLVTADVEVQVSVDDNVSLLSEQREWLLKLDRETNSATLPVSVALQSGEQGYIHIFVVQSGADGARSRSFAVPLRLPGVAGEAAEKSQQKYPGVIEMPAEETIR